MLDAKFTVYAIFCTFILCIILVLYWYHWLYEGPYKQFHTYRAEAEVILKISLGKEPISKVLFQIILRTGKKFLKEGICVGRLFHHFVFIYGEEFSKVFLNETDMFDKSSIYNLIEEYLGNGLLGSNGNMWKVHRKILDPGMSVSYIISKIPSFNRNAHELVHKLQRIEGVPSKVVDEIIALCTFSIVAESVLGFNAHKEGMDAKREKFMKAYYRGKEIFPERIIRPWLYFKKILPMFEIGREHIECIKYVKIFTNEVIQEMKMSLNLKEQSEVKQKSKKSIGQIIFEEHLLKGSFTDEDVADHVRNFLMAGYDTVYTALTWCLYELGHHPEVQQNLFDEIQSVVEGKDVSYEELCRMKYTECVLKETLRLHPPLPIYGRKLSKDVQCGKYTVPKGSEVIFFPFLLHRNPDIYPDPYKFDPDRFMDNSEIRPWMHLAFAEGYRNCIGKKFAMLEMKVLLAHILRTYKVTSLCKVEDSDYDYRVLLKCTKEVELLLTNRDSMSVENE